MAAPVCLVPQPRGLLRLNSGSTPPGLTCLILTICLSYDHPIESNKGRTERGI
jgi:hypothetical protein